MAERQTVEVPGLKTLGPYSHAVRAAGLLFVSGQPGTNPVTGEAAGPTLEEQARQAFKNLDMVLQAGGSRMDLVVSTTFLVANISQFAVVNQLFAEHFPASPPARMTMQVPLPKGLLISVGCVAALAD
jgi:2-iminobutanoate/2-iminopropanoate deaminase